MDFSLPTFPQLETERLLLRQENSADAKAVFAVFSDPLVTPFHNLDTFTKVDEAVELIERRAKRFADGRGIHWGIARQLDNVVIGSVGFIWDKQTCSADIGYELKSGFWRQGIMSEALPAVLQFGFEQMSLQFISAEVMLDNIASKNLLKKFGFECQGMLKQHSFLKGQYYDLEQFVLPKPGTKAI